MEEVIDTGVHVFIMEATENQGMLSYLLQCTYLLRTLQRDCYHLDLIIAKWMMKIKEQKLNRSVGN